MSLWFNNIIFCTNVIFWTNILCTEKACAYSLYLLATNPSGASTTLVIHMPHVCQTLRTGLLLWNPIPDTKLSAAVPIGHLPGTCFFKCSRVVVSKQTWLRGELTAVPSLEHGKQREKQWLWCARKAHHHTWALYLRELGCKVPFLADTSMHKFMWRMNHMLPHWTFAAKNFFHISVDSATGGEKSRKIWCASTIQENWNNSIIIIILSRSSLCPVFWVFYRCLKLWSKISSEGILRSSVFAVIGIFVKFWFLSLAGLLRRVHIWL